MLAELAYKTQYDTQAHHQDDVFLLVRESSPSFHASLAYCRTKKIVPASNLGVSDRVAILSPNCMGALTIRGDRMATLSFKLNHWVSKGLKRL